MLSYAGVDLLVPTPQLEEWVKRFLCYEQASPFQIFYSDLCNYYPQPFPNNGIIKLNSLFWPRDAGRWSFGFFLCTTTQLDAINSAINLLFPPGSYGSGTNAGSGSGNCVCSGSGFGSGVSGSGLSGGMYVGAAPFVMRNDATGFDHAGVSCNLFMLAPMPIARVPVSLSTTGLDCTEGLWLITLVDERYFWNMRLPASQSEYVYSWDNAYLSLFSAVSESTLSSLEATDDYGDIPEKMRQIDWIAHLPHLFDCYLYQTQKRLIRYLTGGFAIVGPDSAETLSYANATADRDVVAGGGARMGNLVAGSNDLSSVLYMPHKECADLRYAIPRGITFIEESNGNYTYKTQYNPFVSQAGANRYKTFNMMYPASSTYYQSFARDWFKWKRSYIDATYAGIRQYTPTGFEDFIEFHYGKDLAYTRVYSGTKNDITQELLSCQCEKRRTMNVVSSITCASGSGSGSGLQVGTEPIIVPNL